MASELPRSISIYWGGLSPEFHVTSVDRSTAPDGGLPGRNREALAGFSSAILGKGFCVDGVASFRHRVTVDGHGCRGVGLIMVRLGEDHVQGVLAERHRDRDIG